MKKHGEEEVFAAVCLMRDTKKLAGVLKKAVPFWERGGAGPKTKFSLKEKMRRRPCADEGLTTKRKYAIMTKER